MLGTVAALRRYPVKSMLGEDVDAGDVTFTGLAGDRQLAVVSRATGKIASAKSPRLWRDLLTLSAAAADDPAVDGAVPADTRLAQRDLILKLLSKVSEEERTLILMKEVEGHSVEELANRTIRKPTNFPLQTFLKEC